MASAVDNNLMRVVETLVLRVGLRNVLLAISAVCAERAMHQERDNERWLNRADMLQFRSKLNSMTRTHMRSVLESIRIGAPHSARR
jgi:hypothetical protein